VIFSQSCFRDQSAAKVEGMATSAAGPATAEQNFSAQALAYLKRPAFLLPGIAVITLLLYISTLSFDFVWDDHVQVESNPLLLSWSAVPRAFHSSLWFQMSAQGKGSYYRPFFIVWSVFNHSLFGFRPLGWHLANVLLHCIASSLVFVLLRRLRAEYWAAAIAALVFAIHPVHIEPVAWISAGSDILVTILYVLTFLCFLQSREGGRGRAAWMTLSWSLFACALLTKEMALTFPVILVLYLRLFPANDKPGALRRLDSAIIASLPYAALNVLYLAERARVLHTLAQAQKNYGPLAVAMTLPTVLMNYLRLLIFPSGLTGFYYTPYVRSLSFTRLVLPSLLLICVIALVAWWWKREGDPLIVFFGLWLPVCLIPVLYLPSFKDGDFVRDRYLYLPSIGFVYLLAKGVRKIRRSWPDRRTVPQPAVVALMFLACSFGVLAQQVYWASDLLVFHRGYELYPQNVTAVKNLAYLFNRQGDPAAAMTLIQQAVRTDPDDYFSHWVLAIVDSEFHQDEQAQQELSIAVNLAPQYFLESAHGLSNLGMAFATAHQYDQAETYLKRSLDLEPDSSPTLVYMGLVLLRTDRSAEAEAYLRKAAAVDPEAYDVNSALGMLAQIRGDRALAEREYYEELRLHPDNRSARLGLAALKAER
jgi:Tfp pilus assembly protein PilF